MNASEVAADRPIAPNEAIKQIAYIRDLLESTKLRLATAWPIFVMWGPLWVLGYSGEHWIRNGGPRWLEWRWAIVNAAGFLGTAVWVLASRRREGRPATTLERRIFWLEVGLFFAFFFGLPLAIGGGTIHVDFDTYIPFYIGVAYFVAGVFLGRELIFIGTWIAACASAAAFLPEDTRWLWFAVNGGGGLFVTGLLLRRQLHRS